MGQPQFAVQQFMLAGNASTFGPARAKEFNLLGVAYRYTVPAGTTLREDKPGAWTRPVLFLRVHVRDAGVTQFMIRVHRERTPGVWELANEFHDPIRPLVFPGKGHGVLEEHFRPDRITLKGFGKYAVTIYFRPANLRDESDAEGGGERVEPLGAVGTTQGR